MVIAREQLWLQSIYIILTSVVLISTANLTKARDSNFDRRMDIFNEVKLIFLMYHMILFTEFVHDFETKNHVGYSCAVFLMAGLATNMFMLVAQPVQALKRR